MTNFIDLFWKKLKPNKAKSEYRELDTFFNLFRISANNKELYKLALTHGSFSDDIQDNERLEFIGDAVFGMVITEELYKYYPNKDEGKLTKLRSKIVGRQNLNKLGFMLNLDKFIYHRLGNHNGNDANYVGNAFEALIGALYLDKGFEYTQKYIKEQIIAPHLDFDNLQQIIVDYKSSVIIWSQKHKKNFQFKLLTAFNENEESVSFKVGFLLDDKVLATGIGKSKKKAEQEAAKNALMKLELI